MALGTQKTFNPEQQSPPSAQPQKTLGVQKLFNPEQQFEAPVHPLETTVRPGLCSPSFSERHAAWSSRRRAIYDALIETDAGPNRIGAFASCGAGYWVLRRRDDHRSIKIVSDYCHDRFCEACGWLRQSTIRLNLKSKLSDHPHRFLSLTLKHDREPLVELLDKLLKCFKRLRATTFWKEKVRGGAAFIEVTANAETGSWHPHLHAIIDGKYLDKSVLEKLWLTITGDSYVVDIRLIRDRVEVTNYITKYATKPLPTRIVRDAPLLAEAIEALKGRKLCYTFGAWSRWSLLKPPPDEEWETYCHANELPFHNANDEDYSAQIIAGIDAMITHGDDNEFMTTADP